MWPTYSLCIIWCMGFFVAFTSSMLIFKKANLQVGYGLGPVHAKRSLLGT